MGGVIFATPRLFFTGQLTSRATQKKQLRLYQRFLTGPNFTVWYDQRRNAALESLKKIYLGILSQCSVEAAIAGKSEVVAIDFFMRVHGAVEDIRGQLSTQVGDVSPDALARIQTLSVLYERLVQQQEAILSASPGIQDSLQHFLS